MALLDILNRLKNYVSYGGALGQRDGDQGDSSQRDALAYALLALLKAPTDHLGRPLAQGYEETVKLHEASPGLYRRSPDPSYWGYNPNNLSRDQHSILRIAMGANKDTKRVKESFFMMAKRFAFHQNYHIGTDVPEVKPKSVIFMIKVYKFFTGKDTDYWKVPDIMTPAEVASGIRSLNLWVLFPLLVVLDLFLLLDLVLRVVGLSKLWDSDNMGALTMLYSYKKMCTPVSWLAMKLYKRTDFMARIKNYYSEDNGANGIVPLYELYKLAYEELT